MCTLNTRCSTLESGVGYKISSKRFKQREDGTKV